jgi:hypothetical protein
MRAHGSGGRSAGCAEIYVACESLVVLAEKECRCQYTVTPRHDELDGRGRLFECHGPDGAAGPLEIPGKVGLQRSDVQARVRRRSAWSPVPRAQPGSVPPCDLESCFAVNSPSLSSRCEGNWLTHTLSSMTTLKPGAAIQDARAAGVAVNKDGVSPARPVDWHDAYLRLLGSRCPCGGPSQGRDLSGRDPADAIDRMTRDAYDTREGKNPHSSCESCRAAP